MRRLLLLVLPAALLLAACDGGGDADSAKRTGDTIHRLFMAALTQEPDRMESFVGELPPELASEVEIPLYSEAEIVVSIREPVPLGDLDVGVAPEEEGDPQPVLYFILLDTDDDRDRVFRYYEDALDDDPWQLESTSASVDVARLWFLNVEDADISGQVAIAVGGEEERTTILISLEDAGALSSEEPAFELGESLPVPKDFPPDVPQYDGATITESAFFRAPQRESSLLVFLTTDSKDDVMSFYREELEAVGWTVEEGDVFGLEERIIFSDDEGNVQGEVTADEFLLDSSFTEVIVRVQVDPAREIGEDGEETPGPSPSPRAEETASPTSPRAAPVTPVATQ